MNHKVAQNSKSTKTTKNGMPNDPSSSANLISEQLEC